MKEAFAHGADMVEFDVQLTLDKIPVIYHDFELSILSQEGMLIPMQLNSLTLEQLRALKIHHIKAIDNNCFMKVKKKIF